MAETTAILMGGRSDLPEHFRTVTVRTLDEKVTIAYAGVYEHFTHNGEYTALSGREVPVFTWSYRTTIAE